MDPIQVLLVDNDDEVAERTADFLEREDEQLSVERARSAAEGLERVGEGVDAVVAEFDLPDTDGLEFFAHLREVDRLLPFILFPADGSETLASDAISAGVSEYLPKETGAEQLQTLLDRIREVVSIRRTERQTEHRHRDYEKILQTVPACVVRLDVEGRMEYANRRAEEVLGLDPEEVTERTYNDPRWNITDLEGNPIPDEELPFRRVRDSGEPIRDFRHTIEWTDGTQRALLVNGAPLFDREGRVEGAIFALTDITEHLERERERREMNQRLRAVVEASPAAIIALDIEGNVELWNPAAEWIFGWSASEVIGGTNPIIPDEHADEYADLLERIRRGESFHRIETRRRRKDGDRIDVSISAAPIRDADDEIVGIMGALQDITERKHQERKLQRQNERLDEFASVISHELRNPLNVAAVRLELARREQDSETLEAVANAHDRMDSLIEDVLTLAREGKNVREMEVVDLAEVCESASKSVEMTDATIVIDIDRRIRADPKRLRSLLGNLVRNAVQHGGDEVTVTIGELEDGFYVEDDGRGLPDGDRDKIFEVEYSTSEGGTGFGLRIVEQIAEAHGWRVEATDGDQGGARFEIRNVEKVSK